MMRDGQFGMQEKNKMVVRKKYFRQGRGQMKVKVTYKNNPLFNKVVESKNGCYIDHWNNEIRVRWNRPYNVLKQAEVQNILIKEVEVDE